MLVLLPPSQGKTPPAGGRRAGLAGLAYGAKLRAAREELVDAVDPALRARPARPAADLYTGVLFAALDLPSQREHWRKVLIASALWGVVRPGDRIPDYKLDMSAKPAGIGLAAFWREPLAAALPDRGLVLDLRSGPYAAAWRPRKATVVTVRARTPDGRVITHMAKQVRGEVARIVLPHDPRSPGDVLELVRSAGLTADLDGTEVVITRANPASPTPARP